MLKVSGENDVCVQAILDHGGGGGVVAVVVVVVDGGGSGDRGGCS